MNFTVKGDLVRTTRTVMVVDAPLVRSGRVTVATDSVSFNLTSGPGAERPVVTYMILQGRLVTGPESKSGGNMSLTYTPDDCPDWVTDIMREVC